MKWRKLGRIFEVDTSTPLTAGGRAQCPVVDALGDGRLRVYFSSCDSEGRSRVFSFDVLADDPSRIAALRREPVIDLGPPGTFDCDGVMPSCVVRAPQAAFLYLIGWNRTVTVPYHQSIGAATSEPQGARWRKLPGPVMDRAPDEPYAATGPSVLFDGGVYRMWYGSSYGWLDSRERMEIRYHIRYAESDDGLNWKRAESCCLGEEGYAMGKPCVWREDGGFRMIYSYRRETGFRESRDASYRLGYAESSDGMTWTRKDEDVGIERSESGWDSEMIAYACLHGKYLFYNGNGFGRSGIGVAERIS